jgi:hypothetical protein
MVLEDEDGVEFDAVYIGKRTGLSGGWRGFAMHHNLEDGDSLVFELAEHDRFKVCRAFKFSSTLHTNLDQIDCLSSWQFKLANVFNLLLITRFP